MPDMQLQLQASISYTAGTPERGALGGDVSTFDCYCQKMPAASRSSCYAQRDCTLELVKLRESKLQGTYA